MQSFNPEQALNDVQREFGEHGGVNPSISSSAMFTVLDPATLPEIFHGTKGPFKNGCYLYSRHVNPTVGVLSRYLAAMEGTEAARCTASGMAAIACTLLQLCKKGDHIVASHTIYGGTHALLNEMLPETGINTTFVAPSDISAFEEAITDHTRVIYVETVGNPTLEVADIQALAALARKKKIPLVVDNTFTPMILSPARLGADIVIYSMTKFINGAGDIIAGAICASRAFIDQLLDLHTGRAMLLGPTLDAEVAFRLIQRLPHLAIRMREHSKRALALAKRLHAIGVAVGYPGLPSHPQHALMNQLMNKGFGYGGMFTIDCATEKKADALMANLQNKEKFGYIAVSLGYFDTLMSCSGASTSSEISVEEQAAMGLSPGLIRFSMGLTGHLDERIRQMERAVKAVGLVS